MACQPHDIETRVPCYLDIVHGTYACDLIYPAAATTVFTVILITASNYMVCQTYRLSPYPAIDLLRTMLLAPHSNDP
jgi:hypothetical protein